MMGVGARLSFLRRALATRRWSFFKWFWLALGAYDLVLSQLVPKSLSDSFPKTYEALTTVSDHISWQAWTISGFAILVIASIEYSFRRVRTADAIAEVSSASDLTPKLAVSDTIPPNELVLNKSPSKTSSDLAKTKSSQLTIAILPLNNMSRDPDQEYFADGITEDIINGLVRFRWLQVIGRASSFTFKGKTVDPSTVGAELGARYIVTGSVRKSGEKFRVAAQLMDTYARTQIWSSHFDGDLTDIFTVQDEVTEKIVAAIEPALKSEEIRRSLAKGTSNLAAYDYYLRALSKAHLFTEDALRDVEKLLHKTIDLDPTFADAYAWLSLILSKLIVGGWVEDRISRSQQGAPAIAAGSRAIELDPENGAALAHTAFATAAFQGDLDHAANLARKALIIQSNAPATLAACGWTLIYDGDIDTALDCLLKAHRLDPVDPGGYRTLNGIALAYVLKRDFSAAEIWSGRALALSPLQSVALRMRAIILAYQGRIEEARTIGRKLRAEQGHYQLANSMRHQWMRDLVIEGMRIAGIPGDVRGIPSVAVTSRAKRPSIAVLPFANISGDLEQEYFADGITEDIIEALARFSWLQIIGRASSFTFKGKTTDLGRIADELSARYVLTGSVRKSAGTIRVTAQLVDASTRTQIWSSHFDGDLSDLFKVQDSITENVVSAIEPALKSEEIRRSFAKGTTDLAAYDYYLRALSKAHLFTEEALREVETSLRKAIELDPTFADAYSWLCFVLSKLVVGGWVKNGRSRSEQGAPAIEAGSRALDLDPQNGAALAHTAFAIATFGGALDYAANLARKALLIQPNSPTSLASCGWTLIYDGDIDAALDCLLKAHRLDPVDPEGYRTLNGIALAYILKRDFSTAETWSRRGVALSPLHPVGLRMLAIILAHEGRIDEAHSIGCMLRAEQGHYQFLNAFRHQWMRDLLIEGMRCAEIPDISDRVQPK